MLGPPNSESKTPLFAVGYTHINIDVVEGFVCELNLE